MDVGGDGVEIATIDIDSGVPKIATTNGIDVPINNQVKM